MSRETTHFLGAALSMQETVQVDLDERSYTIAIESGILDHLDHLPLWSALNHAVVISDRKVASFYLEKITTQLRTSGIRLDSIVVPEGEVSKSVNQLEFIWNQLLDLKADRKSTVVALGGGVVGDLAGFAAASFARGIDFVQIPTSLLAQVDSSVGGKTGINLPDSKNMVGAFWQPKTVIIDPDVLSTLDVANYRAGLAEVIKYGVIMDESFFTFLQANAEKINRRDSDVMTSVIAKCCQLKAQVVQEDELETTGRRAILNYGHTFGHAIENVFGYGHYLHGEAIAIGMHCAAKLACRLGKVDSSFVETQQKLIKAFNLPIEIDDHSQKPSLVKAMHRDKKVMSGVLKLILPTRIGHVEHCEAPPDDVLIKVF